MWQNRIMTKKESLKYDSRMIKERLSLRGSKKEKLHGWVYIRYMCCLMYNLIQTLHRDDWACVSAWKIHYEFGCLPCKQVQWLSVHSSRPRTPRKRCLTTKVPKYQHTEAPPALSEKLSHAHPKLKYHMKNMNIVHRRNKKWRDAFSLAFSGQLVQKSARLQITKKYIKIFHPNYKPSNVTRKY
jgi:hypothetical protein